MYCPYCNSDIKANVSACPHCGHALNVAGMQARKKAGILPGQKLEPVFIDEDVDTIVFSNPIADEREDIANWVRPTVAFAMALASVVLFGLIAQSSISTLLHIGDAPRQATSEQANEAAAATSEVTEGEADQAEADQAETAEAPAAEAEPQSPPAFVRAEASTTLESGTEEEMAHYQPSNAIDREMGTAWNEGSPGNGVGEWVEIQADRPQHVSGVRIVTGFASDEGTYYSNCRPSKVTLTFDDHTSVDMELEDLFAQYQTLDLEQSKDTTSIRVTIVSVYEGSSYSDCCISEVQAF